MRDLISPRALSELIGSIYDCALDPNHWDQTLSDLRYAFGSGGTALGLMDRRRGKVLVIRYAGLEGWQETQWRRRGPAARR